MCGNFKESVHAEPVEARRLFHSPFDKLRANGKEEFLSFVEKGIKRSADGVSTTDRPGDGCAQMRRYLAEWPRS